MICDIESRNDSPNRSFEISRLKSEKGKRFTFSFNSAQFSPTAAKEDVCDGEIWNESPTLSFQLSVGLRERGSVSLFSLHPGQFDIRRQKKFLLKNPSFSKKRRFSCLSLTEHDILDINDDNALKTQDICFRRVALHSTRLTLQVHTKNMYLSLKYHVL